MTKIIALIFSLFLVFPTVCFAQNGERFFDLGVEVRLLSFDFNPVNIEISNIPPELRQVPVHKDDGYLGLNGRIVTVPGDIIKPGGLAYFSPSFGPEIKIWRFKNRVGLTFINFPITPKAAKENKNVTREIHQYDSGTSRGTGTSLVFYALEAVPLMNPVSWFIEAEFLPKGPFSILAGLGESNFKLRIRNGWDRYDALETYKTYGIFSGTSRKKYLGLRLRSESKRNNGIDTSFLVVYGRTANGGRLLSSAEGISVSLKNSHFFNVALSFSTSNYRSK